MKKLIVFCAGVSIDVLPAKHVDAILVNVPHNAGNNQSIKETKRLFKATKAKWIQLDSGGYQFAQGELEGKVMTIDPTAPVLCSKNKINLAPKHLIQAAAELKPTLINTLDFPIGKYTKPYEREMEFKKKLGFNLLWAKETAELRQLYCPDVQMFIPMQCFNLKQLDEFINLLGDVAYDGWSIPTRNFDIKELALFLVKFYQLGLKRVHILGSTSFFTIALSAFMLRHLFEWVSLDATTWRMSAEYSIYQNRHDLSAEHIRNVIIDEKIINDCDCPWCNDMTFTDIKNLLETDRTSLLRCHNFWVIERAAEALYQNAGTILDLERYLKRKSPKTAEIDKLISTLELVDALKDQDIRILEQLLINHNIAS